MGAGHQGLSSTNHLLLMLCIAEADTQALRVHITLETELNSGDQCGLIMQTECLPGLTMLQYYSKQSTDLFILITLWVSTNIIFVIYMR